MNVNELERFGIRVNTVVLMGLIGEFAADLSPKNFNIYEPIHFIAGSCCYDDLVPAAKREYLITSEPGAEYTGIE